MSIHTNKSRDRETEREELQKDERLLCHGELPSNGQPICTMYPNPKKFDVISQKHQALPLQTLCHASAKLE